MKVRHAKLEDIIGRPVRSNGFTIVAATVRLAGNGFSPQFRLRDLPREKIPAILRAPIDKQFDVAWVRARFPHLFGFTPEQSENEKTFFVQRFVAVPEGASEGIAFECSDYYGRTSLFFSPDERDETIKAQVAEAFWDAFLKHPNDLSDFSGVVPHLGAPVNLHFGCDNGEPFFYEMPQNGDAE